MIAVDKLVTRSRTGFREVVFLSLLVAYLAFLPTGPYPLYVLGLRVEYVLGGALCLASLPLFGSALRRIKGRYSVVLLWILAYLLIIGITTILSSDFETSARAFATTVGYAYLTFVVPPLVCRHMDFLRKSLLILAAAATFLMLYFVRVVGQTTRFQLNDSTISQDNTDFVDPNMTAIGLVMCAIICVPLLLAHDRRRGLLQKLTFYSLAGTAVAGSLLFVSRTATASLGVALVFGVMRAGRSLLRTKRFWQGVSLLVLLLGAAYWRSDDVIVVVDRFSSGYETDTTSEYGRVNLIVGALHDWSSSTKTLLFGNGYYTTNPHNDLFRTLAGDGIIGLVGLVGLFSAVYILSCRGSVFHGEQLLGQNMLFAFILAAMMTYGHTKTMWFAIIFLLAGYLEAEKGCNVKSGGIGQMQLRTYFHLVRSESRLARQPDAGLQQGG